MLSFRRYTAEDAGLLLKWLSDPESKTRLGGMTQLLTDNPGLLDGQKAWLGLNNSKPIVFAELDYDEGAYWPLVLTMPSERGKGFAAQALSFLVQQAPQAEPLIAHVEEENMAGHALAIACGFIRMPGLPHEPGFARYTFPR